MKRKIKMGLQLVSYTLLFLISLIVLVPFLSSVLHIWFRFPDNWFIGISIVGVVVLAAMLLVLVIKERVEKRRILRMAQIPENDQQMMFQEQQNELRFAKNLQWNIIYYLALIFGAIFAVGKAVPLGIPIKIILYTIVLFVFDYGIYFLTQIQFNLRDIRLDITRTKYFAKRFESFEELCDQLEVEKMFFRDLRFFLPIIITALMGFLIDTLLLWKTAWILLNEIAARIIQ